MGALNVHPHHCHLANLLNPQFAANTGVNKPHVSHFDWTSSTMQTRQTATFTFSFLLTPKPMYDTILRLILVRYDLVLIPIL